MNNQTHIKKLKDPAKKRRRYVVSVTGNNVAAAISSGVAILLTAPALVSVVNILLILTSGKQPDLIAWLGCFVALIVCSGLAFFSWSIRQYFIHEAAAIPVVPPVAEQIANLPADEVLLRGSDHPADTPEDLLRAAHGGTDTDLKELLRPNEAPGNEKLTISTYEAFPDADTQQSVRSRTL